MNLVLIGRNMIKSFVHYSLLIIVLGLNCWASASFTTVNATLTDGASQAWANATVIATLRPSPFNPGSPLNNGLPITDSPQTTTTDGSGAFTLNLDDVSHITPAGALWTFCIYPNASVQNGNCINVSVSGTSMNLTGLLSSILTIPVVSALPNVNRAYNVNEVNGGSGGLYWNTTSNLLYGCNWNGVTCTWVQIGTVGVPGNINQIPFNNGSGGFTASPNLTFNPNTNIFNTMFAVFTSTQTTNAIIDNLAATVPSGGTSPTCTESGDTCSTIINSTNSLGNISITLGTSKSTASITLTFGTPALPNINNQVFCTFTPFGASWIVPVTIVEGANSVTSVALTWTAGSTISSSAHININYNCWSQ